MGYAERANPRNIYNQRRYGPILKIDGESIPMTITKLRVGKRPLTFWQKILLRFGFNVKVEWDDGTMS